MTLKVVDIFCGAGGLSKGFEQARVGDLGDDVRFEVVYGVDKDANCMKTFRRNHFQGVAEERLGVVAPRRSTTDLTGDDILAAAGLRHVDVVIGGPNCQGVSAAGLRNAADSRNERFEEFLQLVSDLRPEWFVMENVPGLTHTNNRPLLRKIMQEYRDLPEYDVAADVLLATDFGCAQLRYRLFVVGTRTGHPIRFPNPKYAPPVLEGRPRPLPSPLLPCRTVENAIGYLQDYSAYVGSEGPPLEFVDEQGRRIAVRNHVVPAMSDENRERIKSVREGEDWRSIPVGLLPERSFSTRASDQKGTYGRLSWGYPAFTIIALAGNVSAGPFTHPSSDRPISVREAADLQGFPKDYVFEGDIASLYRQVGNAVPPPVAEAMAEMILTCHYRPDEARTSGRQGRITLDLFDRVEKGKAFPVLTPRHLLTNPDPPATLPTKQRATRTDVQSFSFVEEPENRAVPDVDLSWIRHQASLPGNVRAGKRARAILGYGAGKTLEELCAEAKVSASSIKKWVEGFYRGGLDGWRAYHTPLAALAGGDDVLLTKLQTAVDRVRAYEVEGEADEERASVESKAGERTRRRPHMNGYLRSLIQRYKGYSVRELTDLAGAELGRDVGTVYVGDLLAICDVILKEGLINRKAQQVIAI